MAEEKPNNVVVSLRHCRNTMETQKKEEGIIRIRIIKKYLKVATKLVEGGHPMTKEVSRDLPAEPSATSSMPVDSHNSDMRTLSFNLK